MCHNFYYRSLVSKFKTKFQEDEQVRKNSSPSFTRKLRNSLPFGSDKRSEVSELPVREAALPKNPTETEEVLAHSFYTQLNSAYQSSKIKSDTGSNLSSFLMHVLCAIRTFFKCIDFSLSSEFSEVTLDHFNALFNATNGALPSQIISTVTSLLRALFQINEIASPELEYLKQGGSVSDMVDKLYYTPVSLLQLSMTNSQMESESSVSHLSRERVESAWSKGNKKRIESRLQEINNSVKSVSSSVQDFIRIFEPLVIGAMRRYTVSTDERIQKSVLNLLIQLMQLRVNYSLLDGEGVFVKILLNQLESAECHLWRDAKNVIPDIFLFLVLLSAERKPKTAYFIQR